MVYSQNKNITYIHTAIFIIILYFDNFHHLIVMSFMFYLIFYKYNIILIYKYEIHISRLDVYLVFLLILISIY